MTQYRANQNVRMQHQGSTCYSASFHEPRTGYLYTPSLVRVRRIASPQSWRPFFGCRAHRLKFGFSVSLIGRYEKAQRLAMTRDCRGSTAFQVSSTNSHGIREYRFFRFPYCVLKCTQSFTGDALSAGHGALRQSRRLQVSVDCVNIRAEIRGSSSRMRRTCSTIGSLIALSPIGVVLGISITL